MNPIAEQFTISDFDAIRLKLASPEIIRGWSYGEVTNPETINYRTQKPEKGGLFAEEIFGPSKDWECYCGKYKKVRYKGIVCDKCGVEVTHSLVRRERMGHIELASPVTHIWFLRGVPSKIGLALDLSIQNLERVVYFANFIITNVREEMKTETMEQVKAEYKGKKKQIEGDYERAVEACNKIEDKGKRERSIAEAFDAKALKNKELDEDYKMVEKELKELQPMAIISENTYQEWSLRYGHLFEAGIGAEAIHQLLKRIDSAAELKKIEESLEDIDEGAKREKMLRRIRLFRNFVTNKVSPEWMILNALPVIPPDLRPMVPLDGGRFAASDLNDLYRRIINRNNRLKKLMELNAPEVISRNEKRMLQESVDALIDNSARQSKTVVAATGKKRQLKSIADMLKGKQGRFRQNLLGKRIDYSGRSVIVVGPTLRIDQCGIPKRMALELFKPFVISKLISRGFVHNIRSANRFIETNASEVWDILEEVTKDALVLLNRAPTLHRLGIQAFQPTLIEGKAIQLHPMVCPAFNADFDGDQMAVHVPLTEEAKSEARERMLATRNMLKPAHGQPILLPYKDIAWGIYYMTTLVAPRGREVPHSFPDKQQAVLAYQMKEIGIRETIVTRVKGHDKPIETSVGRLMFNAIFPEDHVYLNDQLDTKKLTEIVRSVFEHYGHEQTAIVLDKMKEIGFHNITKSGYSWGMADLPDVPEKKALVKVGDDQIEEIDNQYQEGLLTNGERHAKVIEIWTSTKDKVTKLAKEYLPKGGSVASMIDSGARGSWGQLTQIIGMKGLVTNPANEIIELPVKAGFKDGLDVLEYFISTHGARKGLADTALRTANAGYLTRRLVDVSQDIVIRAEDCGTDTGIKYTLKECLDRNDSILARLTGRVLLKDLVDADGKVLEKAGVLLSEAFIRSIAGATINEAEVRSVLECRLSKGVCKMCYGYDLAFNKMAEMGAAVGIMAAQSIGEPGTQLTMRTFHTGGVAGVDITQGLPRVEELFEARPPKRKAFMSEVAGRVTIEEIERRTIEGPDGQKVLAPFVGHKIVRVAYTEEDGETYKFVGADDIKVKEGDKVVEGEILITRASGTKVIAKAGGKVKYQGRTVRVVRETEKVQEYLIPPGFVLFVKNGESIEAGTSLTEGDLDLHQLYALRGKEAVQKYILKDIQGIYVSQGQKLNDKHIEIIIKQMFSRVLVKDPGDTDLLPGEVIEKAQFLEENKAAKLRKGKEATCSELFLGITKVALSTQSFLSAASFQETAKVLINAAITGKNDPLEGLKENVIIGRLIPAGTGYGVKRTSSAGR